MKLRMIRAYMQLVALMESPHRPPKDKLKEVSEMRDKFYSEYTKVLRVFHEYDSFNLERASRFLLHLRTVVKNFAFSRTLEDTCAYPGYLAQREESVQYLRLLCQSISELGVKTVPYFKTRDFPERVDPRILLHADSVLLEEVVLPQPNCYLIKGLSVYCDLTTCLKKNKLTSSGELSSSLISRLEHIIAIVRGSENDTCYRSIQVRERLLSEATMEFMAAYNCMFA